MPNVFNPIWVDKLQAGLQTLYDKMSLTRWMEGNAKSIKYHGGRTVSMTEMSVDGMGDYNRSLGYPRGAITGQRIQYLMAQDRGREFVIDVADQDETGFLVTAASVLAEFQNNHVVPEVDAYRISQVYSLLLAQAPQNVSAANISMGSITDILLDDLAAMEDANTSGGPLVILMSSVTQSLFGRDFTRSLDYSDFGGRFKSKVVSVDGNPLSIMPSRRLQTSYLFLDGTTPGEEAGGIAADPAAEEIKWMIIPMNAPIAVKKIDKVRVFTPDEFQDMHAWKIDYRLFHDVWLPNVMAQQAFCRTGAFVV